MVEGRHVKSCEEIGGNLIFTNHKFNTVKEVDAELKVSITCSLTLIGIVNSNKITILCYYEKFTYSNYSFVKIDRWQT